MLCTHMHHVLCRFWILTAARASMKMAVFWVVALCSLVDIYQCFGSINCIFCTFVPSGGILSKTPFMHSSIHLVS
jgi:hypothetical protein